LTFVDRARKCKRYSQRERILKNNIGTLTLFFAQAALEHFGGRHTGLPRSDLLKNLSVYDGRLLATVSFSPAASEPDPGPDEVWRATHYESRRPEFLMGSDHHYLRERGYVFWDRDRLADWDLLTVRWENDLWVPKSRPTRAERDEQMQSIRRRNTIYHKEGRGWWSKDDKSRVVYPDYEKRAREREARKQAKREEERAYYRWLQKKGMRPMGPEGLD
jgi:hypothetical protein